MKNIKDVLRNTWGYESFRPLQEDIINSILRGEDTLGLMPTGGGKSITFQVPGLCYEEGLTIVVTPLISLMKDQVDNLKRHRVKAVALHSGMTTRETRLAWEKLINGGARFLYISPERIKNERFLDELRNLKVNLITVDESHCISQWGYDFRPSYLNIKKLRKVKPDVPILALTATATPRVVTDIMHQLDFRKKGNVYRKSFSRDNISYLVRRSDTKIYDVLNILSKTSGSSIVYVRSRKRTKEISDYLNSAGISATYYHAGLDNSTKECRQNEWKQGSVRVMVATNAFGMGIDKPDVRVVIHYGLPPSLEEYYQEAGRAGRDGLPSFAVMLAGPSDKGVLHRHITEAFPPRDNIKTIYEQICIFLHVSVGEGYESVKEFNITRFCELFKHKESEVRSALRLLGQAGYMEFIDDIEKRSRLKFLVEREELYDERFSNPITEKVLSISLRLYTGLFSDYKYINETEIASSLNISQSDVYQSFLELDKRKIVSYIPRSGLPLIYLPTSREEIVALRIGKNIYEERKVLLEERVEAIIDYTFVGTNCRVKRMLAYFGETDSCDCGICDVCREKKNQKKRGEKEKKSIEKILEFLKLNPGGCRYIALEKQCMIESEILKRNLAYLCSEGFVLFKDGLYFLS